MLSFNGVVEHVVETLQSEDTALQTEAVRCVKGLVRYGKKKPQTFLGFLGSYLSMHTTHPLDAHSPPL